jgi:endonuclease YncB( thermonuclease family)
MYGNRQFAFGLAVCLLAALTAPSPSEPAARLVTVTVVRVADGDTLTAETDNGTKLRIRLLGIDAPEVSHNGKPGQPFGTEAQDHLVQLVRDKKVRV